MLLRRITQHVQAQNWTAVVIDFVIVVVGVFIGIQVANWNESVKVDREYAAALRRLDEEIAHNIAQLQTLRRDVEVAMPLIRAGHDALLACADGAEAQRRVNTALNASLLTYGLIIQRPALDTILETPGLTGRLPEAGRSDLVQFGSYLNFVQRELDFLEMEPFAASQARAPSVTFGPVDEVEVNYGGKQYVAPQRDARLAVSLSVACADNDLMKGFWLWERLQGGIPTLAETTINEMEALRQRLLNY